MPAFWVPQEISMDVAQMIPRSCPDVGVVNALVVGVTGGGGGGGVFFGCLSEVARVESCFIDHRHIGSSQLEL